MIKEEFNEDFDLIRRFLEGEEEAFASLVRKYQKKAYYLAYRLTHNHHDANDLSQEAFIKLYSSLKNFKGGSSFFTWFYRIITNLCINHLSRSPRRVQTPVEDLPIPHPGAGAQSAIENKELQIKINAAIEKLPLRQRVAFSLRQLEGLSFKETSQTMDCSIGGAKASYFHAVRKLRKYLKELSPRINTDKNKKRVNGA